MTLAEAEDFRAESASLHDLLAGAAVAVWAEPTDFKGWTPYDVLGHLHMFNQAAAATLEGEDAFGQFTSGFRQAAERGTSGVAYTREWLGEISGAELLSRWRAYADGLADLYRDIDPRRRVPWGRGPGMSARSCISARQMETWAHGQAVFDLLGVERQDADRIRNIAVIGINTYAWSFRNRGLDVPEEKPFVALTAPSGALWTWNDPVAASRVEGPAVEFCQVVAQTRNVADTDLVIEGVSARDWMSFAQCFAGPPHDPPPPGLRRRRDEGYTVLQSS